MICYQQHFFDPTRPLDAQQFRELTQSNYVMTTVAACREHMKNNDKKSYDRAKRGLPLIIFSATFKPNRGKHGKNPEDNWREQQSARLNGLVMADFDHVDNPAAVWHEFASNHTHWLDTTSCRQAILLAHVTPSGQGLRIVATADASTGNLWDNAVALGNALGLKPDEACKDASRGSFCPAADDILYLDNLLFDYDNEEYDKRYGYLYRAGNSAGNTPDNRAEKRSADQTVHPLGDSVDNEKQETPDEPLKYGDYNIEDLARRYEQQNGAPIRGDRHRSLLKLAGHFRYLVDNKPALLKKAVRQVPWVSQWELQESNATEINAICEDICQERMWRELPKAIQGLLDAEGVPAPPVGSAMVAGVTPAADPYAEAAREIDRLMAPPYDVATYGLDPENKIGAVMVAGTMFCTLMTRCWYRHYDGIPTRMNPQTYIIGDPASGKSFAARLDEQIMAVLRAADEPGRQAEARYKREQKMRTTSSKAQKEAALEQPEAVIRYIPSRTSNAVFYRRAKNAKEIVNGFLVHLHLYTFDSELDSNVSSQGAGSWIGKHDLELKAFHNELSGVDFANSDSVNEIIQVFYNTVITGTPLSLQKKINLRNIMDGLCSRIAIFRMKSDGFKMVDRGNKERNYDVERELKEWGYFFDRQCGELHIKRLVDHVYGLCEQMTLEARERNDRVLDYLRKRAVYYAIWFTVPRIVARTRSDKQPSPQCEVTDDDLEFAELMYRQVVYWQSRFFGEMLDTAFAESDRAEAQAIRAERSQVRYSRNSILFEQLPNVFTNQEMCKLIGMNTSQAGAQLTRWQKQGRIIKNGNKTWKKVK